MGELMKERLLRRMRRKREGWLGFFAFLFLWVKGCCCSRAPQKKRQASQEAKAACLFISLSRFCWRNETKAKRKKRSGELSWWIGGLRAAASRRQPANEEDEPPHQTNSIFLPLNQSHSTQQTNSLLLMKWNGINEKSCGVGVELIVSGLWGGHRPMLRK